MKQATISRNQGVDRVKAAAILGVLLIHVSVAGYGAPIGSLDWLSSIFWGSVSRAAVPLFLMCSGALMLDPDRDLPLKKLYTRSIPRLLLALLFWAFCYRVFDLLAAGKCSWAALVQVGKDVLAFHHGDILYYLQIMLLVYAFLPITRVVVKHADRQLLRYLLALWFLLGILYPTAAPFWPFTLLRGIPVQWMLNMTYASIGYGVLGYALDRELRSAPPMGGFALLAAVGFAVVFGATWGGSVRKGALYVHFMEGMTVGVCLLAVGIYGLCAGARLPRRLEGSVEFLSKASFCVFLVHGFFLRTFGIFGWTAAVAPSLLTIPLLAALMLLLGCGVYAALSRVPFVGRWLI